MAKYFLGSVGKAEAFRKGADGQLQLVFVSKTLTDSGLNISTTKDDIRGGEGAPIQFSFYHDPNVEITLTDVVFKKEYVEAQLGAEFKNQNAVSYKTAEVTFASGAGTLAEEIMPLPLPCNDGDIYIAWAAKQGSDEWQMVTVGVDHKALTLAGANGVYCVRYLALDDRARVAEISSQIIPAELYLIITAPIFAGDACAASRGKAAGQIQFEIPRFLLNGAQEFAMNMSANQTMNLSGIALSSESAECDSNGGKLLRIIEVIENRAWYSDGVELIADEDYLKVGTTPHIYLSYKNGTVALCDNAKLTFAPALDAQGKFAQTGAHTISIAGQTAIDAEQVTVAAA